MNPVVISVCVMLALALMRVNVVVALTFSAVLGGLLGGLSITDTISAFEGGLGGGATIALSYAMLGTFAVAISRSGITDKLANAVVRKLRGEDSETASTAVKYSVLLLLGLLAVSSQNLIPIHIAFIPIVIPPLLEVFNRLNMDRRLVACVLTFGLITPYMVLPVGFGGIFLNNILLKNLHDNGLDVVGSDVLTAMLLPAAGMVFGLLTAVFISYKQPRQYVEKQPKKDNVEQQTYNSKHLWIAVVAIATALCVQLYSGSMIVGALAGFMVFTFGGVIKWSETQDVFTRGVHMMAMIGFIMISAAGFAAVMKATGGVESLVGSLAEVIGDNKPLAALLMLVVGLLVTMGIGSSFSTIPIIATIYVPLALAFGFSPLATVALVGTAAALGDAGSPASDSTLGPSSGLNADNQHDHIWDTVVPTFVHYNLPLIIFGWIAAMVL
ncbi:Na+/H+ antiporter family protein [Veronia pacifica]|uniref:Sodium:proton antiporter n=1 Tax=Veronia pacifica TaxID=1080227 RepID=A0A1C3EJT7_9GAMM|nr:Na+/H+ antiporter family protein [Veronia pacifica]ODA33495.1 sodium:proton antiporter [Veronia pacifica]